MPQWRGYFDEDLSEDIAPLLQSLGHDAINTREAGNKGFLDPRQLRYAAETRRVLVTSNRKDFVLLHQAWVLWFGDEQGRIVRDHFGIVVIPNGNEMPAPNATELLDALIKSGRPLTNRVLEWRRGPIWEEPTK